MESAEPQIGVKEWVPAAAPGIIALAVMLATFMEVLDSTVVNVSLPHIAGNLTATVDESTWVLTSYLVSNAVVLPATGWLSRVFGRKRFYMGCVASFTIASALCGTAPTLSWLVLFRVLQGLAGGALQPISQAILLESFPPQKRGMGMALFGIGVIFAPIIGPTLGGWITDNFSWRWIFYINIPVGAISLLMSEFFIQDPPYLKRGVGTVDYTGLGFLAVGIGALQLVLDNGQKNDWFQTPWITELSILAVGCLIGLVYWEMYRAEHPIINFRILRFSNFAAGMTLIFTLGIALYGSMMLLPLFLQSLLGYSAQLSGMAMSPGGIGTLFCMPLVGYLVGRRDVRAMIVFGLATLSVSMFMMSRFNMQITFWHAVWPRMVMGVGLAFLFVPLSTVSFGFMPKEEIGNATGLFNLMRNLGGSFGISAVTTILAQRSQFHQVRLMEHISAYDPHTQMAVKQYVARLISAGSDPALAQQRALGGIYGTVVRQAMAMSFLDCFWLLGVAMLCMIPLVFIMRRPPKHPGPPAAGH